MTDQTNPARNYTVEMLVQCAAEVDPTISVIYWNHPDQVDAARKRFDVAVIIGEWPNATAFVGAQAPWGYTFNNDSAYVFAPYDWTQKGSLSAAIETVMRVVADGVIAKPYVSETRID